MSTRLLALFLISLGPAAPLAATASTPARPPSFQGDEEEFDRRREAAEGDLEALWRLANWCEARGDLRARDRVLRDILELDEGDRKAHELLEHIEFDGRWFESERKLAAYQRKKEREADREARAKGFVRYEDRWVDPADLPFLERGWVRDPEGRWVTREELARLESGWRRQDLLWIPPEEVPFLERDLWKCGDEWLALDEANVYHAAASQAWRIPGDHFVVYGTLPRELTMKALTEADFAHDDLMRIFGVSPTTRPVVLVLDSQDQYGTFSKGDRDGGDLGKSAFGFSSVYGAYFADNWFEDGEHVGAGVTYWDVSDETASRFGPLWVRHAAGQAFVDGLDSSSEALAAREERGLRGFEFARAFWEEKELPSWLRYGAATYVERYAPDRAVGPGGDRFWARKWSIENIVGRGGIDPVETILAFRLAADDPEAASKLINQSGLVVAFMMDGDCEPLVEAHAKFLEAMQEFYRGEKGGPRALEKAVERLEKILEKNEKKLLAFAGQ